MGVSSLQQLFSSYANFQVFCIDLPDSSLTSLCATLEAGGEAEVQKAECLFQVLRAAVLSLEFIVENRATRAGFDVDTILH